MSDDKKTIRVPESDFETARERKEDAGQTWAEYLTDENRGGVDTSEVAEELVDELTRKPPKSSDSGVPSAEEITEELKNELSMLADPGVGFDDGDVERILGRLDDLEAQLPKRVAEELRK